MFLIDTNVVSELRRAARADRNVLEWATNRSAGAFFLSAVTVLELEIGALAIARRDAKQGAGLRLWLHDHLLREFSGRILAVDVEVALRCAELHVPNRRNDRDAYIAATALVHEMTVVTRNVRDFDGTGVPLINPWRDR